MLMAPAAQKRGVCDTRFQYAKMQLSFLCFLDPTPPETPPQMPEHRFDQDAYLKYLDQLTDTQLSAHFRAIDRAREPVKWRYAMDALARRGIFELPPGETAKSLRKRKSFFTPAVKIGIVWALFAGIVIGGFSLSNYIRRNYFNFSITEPNITSSVDGIYVGYNVQRHSNFRNEWKNSTVKKYAFFIRNGRASAFPQPPAPGKLLAMSGELHFITEKGNEFAIYTDKSGKPFGKWRRVNRPDLDGIGKSECFRSTYFIYKNAVYSIEKETDYPRPECGKRGKGVPLNVFVFNRTTGKRAARNIEKGFADFNENISDIFELHGKLYVFFAEYSSRYGKSNVYFKTFDGNNWSGYEQPVTSEEIIGLAHDRDNIFIAYRDNTKYKTYSYIILNGKHKKKIHFGKENNKMFNRTYGTHLAAEHGNMYFIQGTGNANITPAIYNLGINDKKLLIPQEKIVANMILESPYTYFGTYFFLLIIGILIGSRIARKGLAQEIVIAGRTLRAPTLLRRFGALFIDWLIFYPAAIYIVYYIGDKEYFDKQEAFVFLAMVCALLLMFLYSFVLEGMLGGQTLGKKLFKLRVVKDDLTRCTPGAAAVRFLLRHIDSLGAYIAGALAYTSTEKRQRLGDMAARTIVVMDEPGLPREKAKAPERFIPPEIKRGY